ncbi:16S rRNA (cytidine(1402)-2'-O)-methyltransferase [Candidatus Roizmanbacteria bacterium RIFCSPLOWO2_12_FULL_40_12]|nr:MAG: 16S rRNA (cytidine(1402)-2'-O)-methyltransferase [Candidatus Roizmanbacteria bacterium RIFCSPHIGHO2_12_41_18]OGK58765.1 MAG: 16S rRNA (cytidine(1402)-2'-O)-methyltransferase [Candidatus Roizmanbacteria bacterium RIFCSPLOWO2_02_FULL_40_13]OGK60912.1 MAG: 16S rRNA (cytidine(1402)-2'-O)-methyltransferase [Candidatus Roizmanbacteria bacterium RIFCSPLOWO2_12_FULL_40_12]
MLYIVSTPIGNLDDLSYRQARTLVDSDIILAEDTRSYQKLLSGIERIFNLKPKSNQKSISYYKEVEFEKLPEVLGYLESEQNVSLISDAGTPLVSDPGFLLVKEVVKRNIPYDSIPGSSSVTNALVLSGLQAKKWMFVGFFPKRRNDLIKLLNSLQKLNEIDKEIVFIAFESSQRINESLRILSEMNSSAEVVIAREMTKKFQEVLRGKPEELSKQTYKGELTLIFTL